MKKDYSKTMSREIATLIIMSPRDDMLVHNAVVQLVSGFDLNNAAATDRQLNSKEGEASEYRWLFMKVHEPSHAFSSPL